MRCAACGSELKPGAKYCGKCGQEVREAPKARPVYEGAAGAAASAVSGAMGAVKSAASRVSLTPEGAAMIDGVALGIDEVVVKDYLIGRYNFFRQGSINVIVTNKRIIRFEQSTLFGMQNDNIDEIYLDAVQGSSIVMKRAISILGLIVSAALILFSIFAFGISRNEFFGSAGLVADAVISLIVGVIVLIRSFRPTLYFYLHGAIGGPALSTIVNARGRLFGWQNSSIIFQFKPTQNTNVMLREIGAIVYDLKTLGDAAITKWRV